MNEFAERQGTDFSIPPEITGLEHVIEQIGPEEMIRVLRLPADSTVEKIRKEIVAVEGGTIAGIYANSGTSYDFINNIGKDRLTSAMGVPLETRDDDLRSGFQELYRRSLVRELSLDPGASLEECHFEKNARELEAAIAEYGLQPGSTWRDVTSAKDRIEAGLPITASDEELRIAQDLKRLEELANSDQNPGGAGLEKQPGESWEAWRRRTWYVRLVEHAAKSN